MWALNSLEVLFQDIRFALRQLRRSPAFTAVAILTLALGIGANTAIFSVSNALLLRYLPVRDPERLYYLHTSDIAGSQSGYGDTSLKLPMFEQFRNEKSIFSDLMAYVPLDFKRVGVRYGGNPEEAWADMVSGNFFSGLGVNAYAGHLFTMEDESTHASVAVVSYGYWQTRLGRSTSVVGEPIYIKGVPFTIVGVAARGFTGVEHGFDSDIWIPLQTRDDLKPWGSSPTSKYSLYGTPNWWCLLQIGRLAPGVTPAQASAQLGAQFARIALEGVTSRDSKSPQPQLQFTAARGVEGMQEDYQRPLAVLMGMVGLVLVIACSNVAMLLLARNAARQREFSLRMALGGSRMRMFRQLLTESLLLVMGGAAFGLLFAEWFTRALASWALLDLSMTPDLRVLLFTIGVSLAAGLVFGLAPLRSVTRTPVGIVLRSSTANSGQDRGKLRTSRVVVALQIAICFVLLVGAGLLVRTLRNLENIDLGMRTDSLFVFGVNPQQVVHSEPEAIRFVQSVMERLRALPGVEGVSVTANRVGGGVSSNTGAYVDGVIPAGKTFSPVRWNRVGPDFFHVMGIPLLMGRDINAGDSPDSGKVVIINKTFADNYLPNLDPLGHHFAFSNTADAVQYTIVGVARDSKYTGVDENPRPMAYIPYTQFRGIGTMHIEMRTRGNPQALQGDVRSVMREFAPDQPLLQPMTQRAQFDSTITQQWVVARLALFFGLLAVVLVATGLHGTMAYRVARRTSEIGVRMALGAQRGQVLWMVLRESLVVCLAGVAIGLPLAFACTRLLRSMLFGLGPSDPLSIVIALGCITLVALVASFIPARRAATVDPLVALRYE